MTEWVQFFAEQAFLNSVKAKLFELKSDRTSFSVDDGAVSVLACVAATEAMANGLFISINRYRYYDRLRLNEKLEVLADLAQLELNWGDEPWSSIQELIRVRNWLAHYKDSTIGLLGSEGYVRTLDYALPKFTPERNLNHKAVLRYYNAVRKAFPPIGTALNLPAHFDFLIEENYVSQMGP
jgi:hypothetical protein